MRYFKRFFETVGKEIYLSAYLAGYLAGFSDGFCCLPGGIFTTRSHPGKILKNFSPLGRAVPNRALKQGVIFLSYMKFYL